MTSLPLPLIILAAAVASAVLSTTTFALSPSHRVVTTTAFHSLPPKTRSSFGRRNNNCHRNHRNDAQTQKTPSIPSSSFNVNDNACAVLKMANDGGNGYADMLTSSTSSKQSPSIIFPGGGLFFYWQAGVIAHLQEQNYDISTNTLLSGASAGALSATLAKTGVSPYDATELALSMSDEAGVWDRPAGLQGVWGSIIYEWLDQLLPVDAGERVKDELNILVTPVPSFGKSRISQFENRQDLINANMASVHLPWFLDGNLTSNFRGKPHIDGSFLAQPSDYVSSPDNSEQQPAQLILDYQRDPIMKDRSSEFVKLLSKQGIWDILEQGKKHAKIMEREGEFDSLMRR